jgi:N-methylhydantoinase B
MKATNRRVDVVTFEVLRHRLWEINDEMGLLAARISGSPAVYESGDFNTAILTAEGKGLFTGVYVIRQASALDVLVQSVIELFRGNIQDGDMFLTNDPWFGALHAMDYAVIAPVFWEDEIVAWTGVVMHEMDVGGPQPGSWSVGAHDAYQECMLIPPVKIVEAGKLRKDIEGVYLRNTRTPDMNGLNLRAKIAAQVTTRERLRDIIREYGKDVFIGVQYQILDYVRDGLRKRIAKLPNGVWYASALLDHDGVEDKFYRFELKLTKRGNKLIFDFRGTSKQAAGSINSAYSGLIGGIVQVLFPLMCFDLPWSHGAIEDCIEVISDQGTVNNSTFPAATSMATVNACQITGNVVWEALSRIYSCAEERREEVTGLSYGGVNMAVLAGTRPNGPPFVHMFTDSVGGGGARSFRDGIDTCGNVVAPGYAIPNVERIEGLIPVLYVYRKERAETAGAGTWRGGVGIEYMIVPYRTNSEINIVMFGSGAAHLETKGACGGFPGSVQRHFLLRGANIFDGFAQNLIPNSPDEVACTRLDVPAAKSVANLASADAWVCFCTGGGGYGDPLQRAPERVWHDVQVALCTPDEALNLYGVVLSADGSVDAPQTQLRRTERHTMRLRTGKLLGPAWNPGTTFDGQQYFRYGESLAVRRTGAGPAIGCIKCNTALCAATEDPRSRALMVEERLTALSPLNIHGNNDAVVVREYCCPTCATIFSTDVRLRSDDPCAPEMLLDGAQFDKLDPHETPRRAGEATASHQLAGAPR